MPSAEPRYIYGMHDQDGEKPMIEMGTLGWILFDERIFCNPADAHGRDYSKWADQGFGIIVRLNHDYFPKGTIPLPQMYDAFAQRVYRYVKNSRGCHIWIIGNEPNHQQERPDGEFIYPEQYAACYAKCWHQIHDIPGHENDQVVTAAIGPWNNTTQYPGNENGDWVHYFVDVLQAIRELDCPIDAIAHHAYTQDYDSSNPYRDLSALVFSEAKMVPHFPNHHKHFRCYQDFLKATPKDLRHLPVYITETNRNGPWTDHNTGWVRNAYKEIDDWNSTPGNQQIRCLLLYRWSGDQWAIRGKGKVLDDWRGAMTHKYMWRELQYAATFLGYSLPGAIAIGQVVSGKVLIRNDSTMVWPSGGNNPVRLGVNWFKDGQKMDENECRVHLPRDVYHGEKIELQVRTIAPLQEGQYVLRCDLVHEHVTWFSAQGVEPLDVAISVQPCSGIPKPAIENITDRLIKHPTKEYDTRSLDQIRYLVLHHSAVRASVGPGPFATYHVRFQNMPGIRYHYVIGEHGQIWQTNALTTVANHASPVDLESVGICVCGNLLSASPLPEQMDSLGRLCAWLLYELGLSPAEEVVRGRKEFIVGNPDYSEWSRRDPGDEWDAGACWRDTLLAKIAALCQEGGGPG